MKKEFRKKCLDLRKELNNIDLCDKILDLKEYKESKTVFIYVSYKSEADTLPLIKEALKEKTVLVPLCLDDNGNMIACKINSLRDLKEGMYGIMEPVKREEFKGKIDFSIIPGAAFDLTGKRIGYGKGYYDRFLSCHDTFSVGVCHDELLFEKIPSDSFDAKLNMIITNKREVRI